MRKTLILVLTAALACAPLTAMAGRGNDVIVGSVIGGAAGAVIGNGFGGRNGAIIGGALGAAVGVTIATEHDGGGQHYSNNRGEDRYQRVGDERYDYDRDGRDRYDNYRRESREVVVVESPRYYYQGNDFVYGVPPHLVYRGHRGWDRGWHREDRDDDRYYPRDEERYYRSRRW